METAKNPIHRSSSFVINGLITVYSKTIVNIYVAYWSYGECLCCLKQLNLDRLLARNWNEMALVRVYSKPQGQQPDFDEPFVLSAVSIIYLSC